MLFAVLTSGLIILVIAIVLVATIIGISYLLKKDDSDDSNKID